MEQVNWKEFNAWVTSLDDSFLDDRVKHFETRLKLAREDHQKALDEYTKALHYESDMMMKRDKLWIEKGRRNPTKDF